MLLTDDHLDMDELQGTTWESGVSRKSFATIIAEFGPATVDAFSSKMEKIGLLGPEVEPGMVSFVDPGRIRWRVFLDHEEMRIITSAEAEDYSVRVVAVPTSTASANCTSRSAQPIRLPF